MNQKSEFDASPSMLGYLYQVRFGLYLALKKLPEVDEPNQYNLSIETLDDVAFDQNGSPIELIQAKYHQKRVGNITDRSSDIWKTIRVWIDMLKKGKFELGKITLTLVTTQSLPIDSIASYLSNTESRDIDRAIKKMVEVCKEENKNNQSGYNAFSDLTGIEKQLFVSDIYIIGRNDDLLILRSKLVRYGRQYTSEKTAEAFTDRIEGIWLQWCIEELSKTPTGIINLERLQNIVDTIKFEYTDNNLPTEFANVFPDVIDIEQNCRNFIKQLNIFNASSKMKERALRFYYRAFCQRSKWAKDGLLDPGELKNYDMRLREKWEEFEMFLEADIEIESEEGKRKYSVNLYRECIQNGVIPIRKDFTEAYVSKGSYEILSDNLEIGWHPDYLEILKESSNEDAA